MVEQTGTSESAVKNGKPQRKMEKWALLAIIIVVVIVTMCFVIQQNIQKEEVKPETPASQTTNGDEGNVIYGTEALLIKDIKPSPGAENITQGGDGHIIIPAETRENQIKVLREEDGRAFELQVRRDFAAAKITFDISNPYHLSVLNMPEEF